ncbi:MAG: NUDIX hydrolase [Methanobacteriaceae archaeon]|nr:NUDIX hydrolase [Methanobacteriaceae archaeon]
MSKYKNPAITVDMIIFNNQNELVLIKRKNNPYKNYWALPGGFIEYNEEAEHAAIREAKEETNLDIELKKLIGVYSKADRDPRGHTITIAYTAIIKEGILKSDSDAKDTMFINVNKINDIDLAFDHKKIIKDSLKM